MSNLPKPWGFLGGGTSRESPEKVSASKEEEMTIIEYTEPPQWHSTSSATESSDLSDIFRVLSNTHFLEPSLPLRVNTKDDIIITKGNPGTVEHGEPSTGTRKRKVDEMELQKRSSEENEPLLTESKKEEKKAKKVRSTESHNMSERKRRGRIKEKIKSLQQLLPYSDKKDCASILDEAIQYFKTLKDQAAQLQMMSMSMGAVYYNPYMSATGIPHMPLAQYSPYGPFRPGMGFIPLVQMPSPAHSPLRVLPLVHDPLSQPISGNISLPALQPTYTALPTSHLDNQSKQGPSTKELEKGALVSQDASTSDQIFSKPNSGSIVHATHIVPPAIEELDTNL